MTTSHLKIKNETTKGTKTFHEGHKEEEIIVTTQQGYSTENKLTVRMEQIPLPLKGGIGMTVLFLEGRR